MILWEGSSPVDGAPIVCIATTGTRNRKTGPMVQTWILRADVAPHEAIKTGEDASVCGACPLRGRDGKARACYVIVHNAPLAVFKKYKRGGYKHGTPKQLAGMRVRWGAYGDPAMLPGKLVRAVNRVAYSHTGYTHQWRQPWAKWTKGEVMASVETPEQNTRARAAGWGTFFVSPKRPARSSHCAADRKGSTCHECGVCDGRQTTVWIAPHGGGANNLYTLKGKAA